MPEKKDTQRRTGVSGSISGTAQKDKTAKKLEDYSDVFADIVNVLLFRNHPIDPDKLRDAPNVAHFFVNKRIHGSGYRPLDEEIEHLPEFLDFLRVFTKESHYAEIAPALVEQQQKGGIVTMCNVLEYHWNRGLETGRKEGMERGLLLEKLAMIDKLVASKICSFEKACEVAEIAPAEYKAMKERLKQDDIASYAL